MSKKNRTSGKPRSDAMAALHEAASDLHSAGGIDKLTIRRFDLICLTLIEDGAKRVSRSRHPAA
jgi:DNA-binding transcriptional regulator YiaG